MIQLGDLEFRGRQAVKDYLNQYLHGAPVNAQVTQDIGKILADLFTYHPCYHEKVAGFQAVTFKVMVVSKADSLKEQRCFAFCRPDGTGSDFSVIKCLDHVPVGARGAAASNPSGAIPPIPASASTQTDVMHAQPDPTESVMPEDTANTAAMLQVNRAKQAKYVGHAMTQLVIPIKQQYKKDAFTNAQRHGEPIICPYTQEELQETTAHVVVSEPYLFQLKNFWAEERKLELSQGELLHKDNYTSHFFSDRQLQNSWLEHFKAHAKMCLVSKVGVQKAALEENMKGLAVGAA